MYYSVEHNRDSNFDRCRGRRNRGEGHQVLSNGDTKYRILFDYVAAFQVMMRNSGLLSPCFIVQLPQGFQSSNCLVAGGWWLEKSVPSPRAREGIYESGRN